MFGWIRKLTQRTAIEESVESSPPESRNAETGSRAPVTPEPAADVFARPREEPVLHEQLVDVYTPEPMPEPPTFELPEHEVFDDVDQEYDSAPAASDYTDAQSEAEPTASAEPDVELVSEKEVTAAEPVFEDKNAGTELEPSPFDSEYEGLLSAPSPRPAMPLSAHPNFAGLGLAQWEPIAPRLLEPEAALAPAAQEQLLLLFDDLFGPCGRYRLEWRAERHPGDDAMFAEIMTADLVRRVQNAIADAAELERPTPPKAITAAFADREADDDEEEHLRRAS